MKSWEREEERRLRLHRIAKVRERQEQRETARRKLRCWRMLAGREVSAGEQGESTC